MKAREFAETQLMPGLWACRRHFENRRMRKAWQRGAYTRWKWLSTDAGWRRTLTECDRYRAELYDIRMDRVLMEMP
jgi:hypothetical protein